MSPSSTYYLTKEKKLEIHEGGRIYKAKVPLRYTLNPLSFLKNLIFMLIKSKKRLRRYTLIDQKDNTQKTIYLTHSEIQQVWNQPLKEPKSKPSIIKKGMGSSKKKGPEHDKN